MTAGEHGDGELIVVCGMHRSGTSALTRVLNLLGFRIPEPVVPAFAGNELGHWEPEPVVHMNDRLLEAAGAYVNSALPVSPAWFASANAEAAVDEVARYLEAELKRQSRTVIKDPRISLLLPVWRRAIERVGVEPRLVLPFRRPQEAAASLCRRQLRFFPDDVWPLSRGLLIWLNHVLESERGARGARRAFLSYDALLADWRTELIRVGDQIGLALPIAQAGPEVDAAVRGDAKRERGGTDDSLPPDIRRAYDELLTLCASPGGGPDTLAGVRGRFERSSELLGDYLQALERAAGDVTAVKAQAAAGEAERDAALAALAQARTQAAAAATSASERYAQRGAAAQAEIRALRAALLTRFGADAAVAVTGAAQARQAEAARAERLAATNAALSSALVQSGAQVRRLRGLGDELLRVTDARDAALAAEEHAREQAADLSGSVDRLQDTLQEAEARAAEAHARAAEAEDAAAAMLSTRLEALTREREEAAQAYLSELEAELASAHEARDASDAALHALNQRFQDQSAAAGSQVEAAEERAEAAQACLRELEVELASAYQARDASDAALHALSQRFQDRSAAAGSLRIELQRVQARAAAVEGGLRAQLASLEPEIAARAQAERRATAAEAELARMRGSRLWRAAVPLRRLRSTLAR